MRAWSPSTAELCASYKRRPPRREGRVARRRFPPGTRSARVSAGADAERCLCMSAEVESDPDVRDFRVHEPAAALIQRWRQRCTSPSASRNGEAAVRSLTARPATEEHSRWRGVYRDVSNRRCPEHAASGSAATASAGRAGACRRPRLAAPGRPTREPRQRPRLLLLAKANSRPTFRARQVGRRRSSNDARL